MSTTPLITVIIPSYNSPDIFATLQSVVTQDYPRIQLILVDDASANFPLFDIKTYLESGRGNLEDIQILINPENYGTVRTMNRALQISRGEYLFNLASDDCFYDSHVLSDWVAEFQRTNAQVITAYRAIYDDQLEAFLHLEPFVQQVQSIREKEPTLLFEEIAKANYIFGCCTARTATCVRKYGFYDERYRLVEDHPMALKLLRSGEKIHFFDRIVVKYRGGGVSSPIRYSAVYAQDVDNILTYDVLPYTKHPLHMRWFFYQWKREQRLLQKRETALEAYSNSRILRRFIQIRYYLHHPLKVIAYLPKYLLKKQK